MRKSIPGYVFITALLVVTACGTSETKKHLQATAISAKDAVVLNQLVYKPNIADSFAKYAPGYELVFIPKAVNGNFAVIAKNKAANQYAVIIRGSMIEFTNAGFQNFILQDFNIFTMKKWEYADTVKDAYIGRGTYLGFQNLLQLKDTITGLGILEFLGQKIPAGSSVVITGHSLGGNLAYPMAGYLKKKLPSAGNYNLQLITFGAPAAGNASFVQDMEEKFPVGERYVTDRDIAPMFPDLDKVDELSKLLGIDSALNLGALKINGVATELDAGSIIKIAGEILDKTDIIPEGNKYVQSQKHLRVLNSTVLGASPNASVDAIFERAYKFHKVDAYAVLLGGKAIDSQ